MEHITFVGVGHHKRTTSVAIAEVGRGGEVRFMGEIPSTAQALHRLVERLKQNHRRSASATKPDHAATASIGCSAVSIRTAWWSRRR
jgi:hypothetical protein